MASIKPTIAVDIDDVLSASASAFVGYFNEKYGTHLEVADYQENWGEMWKVDNIEAQKRAAEYHEVGHHSTYKRVDGALEALKKLKEDFRLVIITTRRSSINQLTKEWLNIHYSGIFDEVVFTTFFDSPGKNKMELENNLKKTKGEIAKNIGADYLIDDQLKHIEAAAKLGIQGLLFGEYAWNQTSSLPPNVTRVKDWTEVMRFFSHGNS